MLNQVLGNYLFIYINICDCVYIQIVIYAFFQVHHVQAVLQYFHFNLKFKFASYVYRKLINKYKIHVLSIVEDMMFYFKRSSSWLAGNFNHPSTLLGAVQIHYYYTFFWQSQTLPPLSSPFFHIL